MSTTQKQHDRAVDRRPAPGRWFDRLRQRAAQAPAAGTHIFSGRVRQTAVAWVVATVLLAGGLGRLVHDAQTYLVSWFVVSGLSVTPALVTIVAVCARVDDAARRFWQLWAAGLASVSVSGVSVLAFLVTGWNVWRFIAMASMLLGALAFTLATVQLLRSRSGSRALAIDAVETMMLVIAIVGFAPLFLHDRAVVGDAAWFVLPAIAAGVAFLFGLSGAIVLYRSLAGETRTVEGLGVALTTMAAIDCFAHAVHGTTGFQLPATPLLVTQALCTGLLFLTPLFVTKQAPIGLDRLAPQAQVRGWSLDTLALALLAPLVACTMVLRDEIGWALWHFLAVAVALLVLSTVRGKLTMHETRRLYARVETAADERQRLLVDLMRSADHDRHRVAAQLHQQATSFYVTFSSFLRATSTEHDPIHPALLELRGHFAEQTEAMRQLMLAVRPLETHRPDASNLTTTIAAFIDSLYGDAAPPTVEVRVDDELVLDWSTETIVLRILQEALRNTHEHANAGHVEVSIGLNDRGISVRVHDDGDGFSVGGLLFESGIATMRDFAARANGTVALYSRPGAGTTLFAQLGLGDPAEHDDELIDLVSPRPRLSVIHGDLTGPSPVPTSLGEADRFSS